MHLNAHIAVEHMQQKLYNNHINYLLREGEYL